MKVFRTALEAVTRRLSGQLRSRNEDYDYDKLAHNELRSAFTVDTTTTPNMTKDEVNALGFHKLRSACARHGLPATGKACELRKRLLDLIPSAVVAASEPIADTIATASMTLDDVNALGFHKLRSACARHGLPATGKACVLRKRLLDLIPLAVVAASEPIVDTIATASMTITLQSTVEVVDDDTVVKGENGSSIVLHIAEATCNELEKAERKEEEDMQQEDIVVSDGINFTILLGSIPVQDAYRTVSHLDEAMFDFGIGPMIQLIPHKGVFEVLENPTDDMRQALYRDENGFVHFRADLPRHSDIPYTPYTKIRGNAGIEECFYIDAVNRELLLHRRFFFLFNDREALMNALGHMLYDDKELIEEFFVNDETKNRFLVTKSNVPDHKVVLSVDDMDVDVDVYDAYDVDECYKVESQVC